MSARAGIVVTGTEVLSGIIPDKNGPWLSERLRERGVDLAHTMIVGDRPEDMEAALRFLAAEGMDVVITSGGLGPTADDLTAEVVGRFQGRAMEEDPELADRIVAIVRPLMERWPHVDMAAAERSARKQAVVPAGATILEPVGTAPGLVVPPGAEGEGPTVVVLPGPPRELQPMWAAALETDALRRALAGARAYAWRIMRLFGMPESEIAASLRAIEEDGLSLEPLEITTCLRRGEIEIATKFAPEEEDTYEAFARAIAARHADALFSPGGETIDELVAAALARTTIATAESCTGGLLAARLTERAGSSAYVLGGIVAYANEAKSSLAGVDPDLIEAHGAVSAEVADALADGARERFGAEVGVGITGVAGPGGGTEAKPVGTVCLSVARGPEQRLSRRLVVPGNRADVRDRSCTIALHMVRRLLAGEEDAGS